MINSLCLRKECHGFIVGRSKIFFSTSKKFDQWRSLNCNSANKLNEPFPINSVTSVKEKQKIVLLEKDLEEKFVRGSGNGGQKINTTANRVQLTHIPTGMTVSCQDARDLATNRKIARKLMVDKLDFLVNGAESKWGREHDKVRKRKKNAKRSIFIE